MQGLLGRKLGMTRVFDEKGQQVPVTVIEAGPCVVLQRKTKDQDGYEAVQLGFGDQTEARTVRADLGRFKKATCTPKRFLREFDVEDGDTWKAGDTLTVAIFDKVSHVDVTATSKGRGFQGVMKRHGMRGGPVTHGGHSKRRVGSIGCRTFPARVHKGKRMPGHMGHVRVTTQNLRVIAVRGEDNLLLVEGGIPGANGEVVMIRKALKRAAKVS